MTKIVLIGAGSQNFGLGIIGDIFKSNLLKGSKIVLHDINSDTLRVTQNIAEDYKTKLKLDFSIEATTSRKEALKNADFCIISIEVGNRFELWDQDWKLPLQYGIKQVYGENGGPGGLFHSLRIIPAILDIAYGSFVSSNFPLSKYSSFIGCLEFLGYIQLDPRKISFFILLI